MELSADTVNAVEDWVRRLEAAARALTDAAAQMETASNKNNDAASTMTRAVREIPSYIRTGP